MQMFVVLSGSLDSGALPDVILSVPSQAVHLCHLGGSLKLLIFTSFWSFFGCSSTGAHSVPVQTFPKCCPGAALRDTGMPPWEEAGQDGLCHCSFPICATATETDLAPGIQFAEIQLCSIYHLKASNDLDFFTAHQGVCRGVAGAAVLLVWLSLYRRLRKCSMHCHPWQQSNCF